VTRYAALLRGVNVGGRKPVAMADLRSTVAELGFANVATLIQSGNLVFDSARRREPASVAAQLETELARRLDLETAVFVRTGDELTGVIASNPYVDEARTNPGRLVVMFLAAAPLAADVARLRSAIVGPETVASSGRHLYVTYPAGQATTKLTNAVIEKTLGTRGTARNWNTVLRIDSALTGGAGG
jgi:uncharacterized protein (DUF1697 family)